MSAIKFAAAAIAALALTGGVALAKTDVTAKIAAPQPERTRVIAAGVVWMCSGDTCTAKLPSQPNARICMALAREVGQVVAFSELKDEDLARCNTRAAAVATTAVATR